MIQNNWLTLYVKIKIYTQLNLTEHERFNVRHATGAATISGTDKGKHYKHNRESENGLPQIRGPGDHSFAERQM